MRLLLLVLSLLLLSTPLNAATMAGDYTMTFDLSGQPAAEETRLWVPYPVSDGSQLIDAIRWEGDYAEAAIYTDRDNGTPMLFARWPAGTKERNLTLSFRAERKEQVRRDFPAVEPPLDTVAFAGYLAATSFGPTDGPVKALAERITAGKTTILARAKAIYDWTVEQTFRDPETRGCGLGDVPNLLKRPGGKCADISSIYVALARSAGVPAREILGLRSGRNELTDVTTWQHCWAEFFLPGYGWVPVDPADVRKAMLKDNLQLDDPRVATLRESFWGRVDANRIRLSEGRDLQLNPRQQGETVNYLMYPFAQVGSRTIDWLDAAGFRYTLTWRPAAGA